MATLKVINKQKSENFMQSEIQSNAHVSDHLMSEEESEAASMTNDDSPTGKQFKNAEWRTFTKVQCEKILVDDPFNKEARFRHA